MKTTMREALAAIQVNNSFAATKAIAKVIKAMDCVRILEVTDEQKKCSEDMKIELTHLMHTLIDMKGINESITEDLYTQFISIMVRYNTIVLKPILGKPNDNC